MSLSDEIRRHGVPPSSPKRKGPVWEGPESSGRNGGITFSLLSRFLSCRERFRLYVVEGLAPPDSFSHRLEYGTMFHLCEELCSQGQDWKAGLKHYVQVLCKRYQTQQEQIVHWYNVCLAQFPVYLDYWSKHPDVVTRTTLLREQAFNVPYSLPSGRTVHLRGKWDGVDLADGGVWLFETKTKGDVDEQRIRRQLRFDLQTSLYIIALQEATNGGQVL